jgi:hypothetical protein
MSIVDMIIKRCNAAAPVIIRCLFKEGLLPLDLTVLAAAL